MPILGQSPLEGRILSLVIICGGEYPDRAPTVCNVCPLDVLCVFCAREGLLSAAQRTVRLRHDKCL